jgi:hypothetical protein
MIQIFVRQLSDSAARHSSIIIIIIMLPIKP